MTTFSEQSRNSSSWTETNKSTAPTFTETTKSGGVRLFKDVPTSEVEANTFDGLLQGRPVSEWSFNDVYDMGSTTWTNQNKT